MTDLASIDSQVTAFAATAAIHLVPAVPERNYGPEVVLDPPIIDLDGFLQLAAAAGGGLLYHQVMRFDGDPGDEEYEAHRGELGSVSVAFCANNIVHFWEQSTPWYASWKLAKEASKPSWLEAEDDDQQDDEESPIDEDLVATMLADPEFRTKIGSARSRYLRITYGDRNWHEVGEAIARSEALAVKAYEPIRSQLDTVAAQLSKDDDFRTASTAAGRREITVRFLIVWADGFAPPTVIRDEIAARAYTLTKNSRTAQATLL